MASYSSAGVDIKKVKSIHTSIENSIFSKIPPFVLPIRGHYAGLFRFGKTTFAVHCDGVGSKILVADALSKYDTVGIDCVAMNVNDIICVGAKPLVIVDYLALAKEDEELVSAIILGLQEGAKQAGCAIIGGETAILPDMIKGGKKPFDLAAACVGAIPLKAKPITGSMMKPGDSLIGIESSGLHSNGFTLARKVLDFGEWGEEMLTPTKIYVKPILEMIEKCKIHGLAHITGGAFSKLSRIGRYAKVGFLLDNMPRLSGIMAELYSKIGSDYEMYRTFNCGIGMCVACPPSEEKKALAIARKHGFRAQRIGSVIRGSDVILEKEGRSISLL